MDDQRKPRRTFPWFKFYAAEVFARTAELSTHELGAIFGSFARYGKPTSAPSHATRDG